MKSTRKAYGETLAEIGDNKDIVVLDADLSKSTMTSLFRDKYPERHINIGISEQDMVDTAVGLALSKKIPFCSSFAIFLAGRAFEQVRNGVAYNKANVKLVATHAGITVGEDGATHQSIEDLAIMRAVPNMTVICPSDEHQTKYAIKEIAKKDMPVYVRLGRVEVPEIYNKDTEFEFGKAIIHGDGIDGTIFATGYTVHLALEAKQQLKSKGINVRVVDMWFIKPIDKESILKCARETEKLVSIEEHNIIGGLGSSIAEVLIENEPKKLKMLGINDEFGKSGKVNELLEKYKLTTDEIIEQF